MGFGFPKQACSIIMGRPLLSHSHVAERQQRSSAPAPDKEMRPGSFSHGSVPRHPGGGPAAAGQDVGHEINFLRHLNRTGGSLGANKI